MANLVTAKTTQVVNGYSYNRSLVKAGILHFGVGNFHRAHLEFMTNKLLENNTQQNWGIHNFILNQRIKIKKFVGVPGLEPGKAGPESAVLPLHHTPNLGCTKENPSSIRVQNYCFLWNTPNFSTLF